MMGFAVLGQGLDLISEVFSSLTNSDSMLMSILKNIIEGTDQ